MIFRLSVSLFFVVNMAHGAINLYNLIDALDFNSTKCKSWITYLA